MRRRAGLVALGLLSAWTATVAPAWGQSSSPSAPPEVSDRARQESVLLLSLEVLPLTGQIEDLQSTATAGSVTTVTLSADVLFDFGRATLSSEAIARITQIAAQLPAGARGGVRIEGHTDGVGTDEANLALSEQRAAAVKDTLVAGVPGLLATASGRGETQPVVPNEVDGKDSPENRAKNRRVTISYG